MKIRIRNWLAPLAILIATAPFTQADKLVVGVENLTYLPYYSMETGKYQGAAREILDLFAEKNGHTIEYKAMPLARLFSAFVEGEVDLKFPDNAYWGGDAKKGIDVVYSQPVLPFTDGVFVLPSNTNKGKESLKTLGAIIGFTPFDYLGQIESGAMSVKNTPKLTNLIQMLKAGRIDGLYYNRKVSEYYSNKAGFGKNDLVFDDTLPHTNSNFHLSGIKRPEIVKQFDDFMQTHASDVANIKAKYGL